MNSCQRKERAMEKLTRKEKREMIAAAMKAIREQPDLTPAARERGLNTLQKAYEREAPGK